MMIMMMIIILIISTWRASTFTLARHLRRLQLRWVKGSIFLIKYDDDYYQYDDKDDDDHD